MGKKSGKSGKAKDKQADSGFSFAGFDIPQALRNNGLTVDNLARHPLVAGLAAMALETLASQIRARAAAPDEEKKAADPAPAPTPAPQTARKPAAAKTRKTPAKPAAKAQPARKPATRKPAGTKASPDKAG